MSKTELLAPVGKMDTFIGVINAGANAVYLAGKRFGARGLAENFTKEEIRKLVSYAHLRNVLVYVTINTLVFDNEIEDLIKYADYLVDSNVDAFILQDLGVLSIFKKRYGNQVKLHASTQLNTYSVQQAIMLKKMGIDRIILAREVSVDVIKEIKQKVDIEIEVFVHGALCVCYSGNCLFSSIISNRSGNRGVCAQPCRLPYRLLVDGKITEKNKYLLSTKDLITLDHINELNGLVDSIKIEGRLRSFEYSVQSVLSYREALDNKNIKVEEHLDKLKRVFNREFTKGFMFNAKSDEIINSYRPNHMGVPLGKIIEFKNGYAKIKLQDNLAIGDGIRIISDTDFGLRVDKILCNSRPVSKASFNDIISIPILAKAKVGDVVLKTLDKTLVDSLKKYNNEHYKLVGLNVIIYAFVGEKLKTICFDELVRVEKEYNVVEVSNKESTLKDDINKQFNKLGNTPFYLESLNIISDELGFLSVGVINEIRRDILNVFQTRKCEFINKQFDNPSFHFDEKNDDKPKLVLKVKTLSQLNVALELGDIIYYPHQLMTEKQDLYSMPYYPRIWHNKAINKINIISDLGWLYENDSACLIADKYFNVTNTYAYIALKELSVSRVCVSDELNGKEVLQLAQNIKEKTSDFNLEVSVYNDYELMIIKSQILNDYDVKNRYVLADSLNNKYKVTVDEFGSTIIEYSRKDLREYIPAFISIGIKHIRVELSDEDEHETRRVISQIKKIIDETVL